jgi:probable HAF family extracellular repeat protein
MRSLRSGGGYCASCNAHHSSSVWTKPRSDRRSWPALLERRAVRLLGRRFETMTTWCSLERRIPDGLGGSYFGCVVVGRLVSHCWNRHFSAFSPQSPATASYCRVRRTAFASRRAYAVTLCSARTMPGQPEPARGALERWSVDRSRYADWWSREHCQRHQQSWSDRRLFGYQRGVCSRGAVGQRTDYEPGHPARGQLQLRCWINERGQIVGYSDSSAGARHAVLWDNGRTIDLGTLPGGNSSSARAINARGQIVGVSRTSTGVEHAVLWSP